MRVNMVDMLCTHICKFKNETYWNGSRTGEKGNKGERWGEWIQLWYIARTFVNITRYCQYNNNKKEKWHKHCMHIWINE
jgi:hypothetical protein